MIPTLIILGCFVWPLILGPTLVPYLKRRAERRLLEALQESGERGFSRGKMRFRKQFDFLGPCDRETVVCCSHRTCGGQLIDVDEEYRALIKESGREARMENVTIRIGIVCLSCGHLEKTADSRLLGHAYRHIGSARMLALSLKDRMMLLRLGVPI